MPLKIVHWRSPCLHSFQKGNKCLSLSVPFHPFSSQFEGHIDPEFDFAILFECLCCSSLSCIKLFKEGCGTIATVFSSRFPTLSFSF